MSDCYSIERGDSPLLISVPHDGRKLAPGMAERMTQVARSLPDTDWHVRELYQFATVLGASIISARYSRYVVDLNRASTDDALYAGQVSTGLCPSQTFAGADIYADDHYCDAAEQLSRINAYWQPYHDQIHVELARIKKEFGYALLWDAHSIRSQVPLLFDGTLPDLNLGTNGGDSCDNRLEKAVAGAVGKVPYSFVANGRFKGGFITRHFGAPKDNIHAIQLELAQHRYMDEETFQFDEQTAERLRTTLHTMLAAFIRSAERHMA